MTDTLDTIVRDALAVYLAGADQPAAPAAAATAHPSFAEPKLSPRRRPRVAFVTVAAAALAAILVAGLIAVSGRDSGDPAAPTDGELRRLVSDLPSGWSVQSVDGPGPAQLSNPGSIPVRGAVFATDAAPAGPIAVVYGGASVVAPGNDGTASNYTELTLDDRRAALADGRNGQRMLWVESDGHWIVLESRGLDDEQLQAFGVGVTLDEAGQPTIDPGSVPAALHRVPGDLADFDSLPGDATMSWYGDAQNASKMMILHVERSNALSRAFYGLIGDRAQAVDVGGHPGFVVGRVRGGNSVALLWDQDGLAMSMVGAGLSQDEFIAAAASVRPVSASAWNALPSRLDVLGYTSDGEPTAGTAPTDTAAPSDFDPSEPTTGPTSPATTQPSAIDRTYEQDVRDVSSSETRFEATTDGKPWSAVATIVFDNATFASSTANGEQAFAQVDVTTEPIQFAIVGAGGLAFINVVATDGTATALRVTMTDGTRFTAALHANPTHADIQLGVIAVKAGQWRDAEIVDSDGNILAHTAGSQDG